MASKFKLTTTLIENLELIGLHPLKNAIFIACKFYATINKKNEEKIIISGIKRLNNISFEDFFICFYFNTSLKIETEKSFFFTQILDKKSLIFYLSFHNYKKRKFNFNKKTTSAIRLYNVSQQY